MLSGLRPATPKSTDGCFKRNCASLHLQAASLNDGEQSTFTNGSVLFYTAESIRVTRALPDRFFDATFCLGRLGPLIRNHVRIFQSPSPPSLPIQALLVSIPSTEKAATHRSIESEDPLAGIFLACHHTCNRIGKM